MKTIPFLRMSTCSAFVIYSIVLNAQVLKENADLWQNEVFGKYKPENEIIELRNENTKHFINEETGETEAIVSNGFLHYKENNQWKTILNTIEMNGSDKHSNYAYYNRHNSYQTYYSTQSNELGVLTFINNNSLIDFINVKYYFVDEDMSPLSALVKAQSVNAVIDKNTVSYPDLFNKIDAVITQHSKQRKLDYVIKEKSILQEAPLGTKYMVFDEQIIIPSNWYFKVTNNNEVILFFNERNEYICKITQPRFYENSSSEIRQDGEEASKLASPRIIGKYNITQSNDTITLSTIVPFEWVNYEYRKFPVKIDPTWDYVPSNISFWSGAIRTANGYTYLSTSPSYTFVYDVFGDYLSIGCWSDYYYDYYYGYIRFWDHAFSMFNISSIPAGATISSASLTLNPNVSTYISDGAAFGVQIRDFTTNAAGSSATAAGVLADIRTGNVYVTTNMLSLWNGGNFTNWTLPATSVSEIQTRLSSGYYGLGLHAYSGSGYWDTYLEFHGRSSIYAPFITITYNNPLPVQLVKFEGKCDNHQVAIRWKTASEINNAFFLVEKSLNGLDWETTHRVSGAGNSNEKKYYEVKDDNHSLSEVYYRLTQIDFDGKSEVFTPIVVKSCNSQSASSVIVFPNPVNEETTIKIVSPIDINKANIMIADINGKLIYQHSESIKEGANSIVISTASWATGVYFVKIENASVVFDVQKIIKQ